MAKIPPTPTMVGEIINAINSLGLEIIKISLDKSYPAPDGKNFGNGVYKVICGFPQGTIETEEGKLVDF